MDKNIIAEITALYQKLTMPQRLIIAGAVVGSITLLILLMTVLNEPEYSVLFTNLQEEDASQVLDQLNEEQIPYQIADEGRVIKVPKEVVYETRLSLSGKGIPGSGTVGYEIFDQNTMGMSEFMQKLNFKRAIEGEVARTITQQDGIEGARVHIVMPEKSVFKDEEKLPTASILLKLAPGYKLKNESISAITHLISSSVEGLEPQNVTVLDSRGKLLSKENSENNMASTSSTQYELQQSVENYLAQKAQNIMDNVLGYGNAMIKVNVDLNFDQVEKTMEIYDPDSQVAISEQLVSSENVGRAIADSQAQMTQNTITNYEINKTTQRIVEGAGAIKRLSIAAVINDVMVEQEVEGQKVFNYEPRPQAQIRKLERIIVNAVGFDATRNDQISIVSIPFETKINEFTEINTNLGMPIYQDYNKLINLLIVLLSIGGALLIVRKLLKKVGSEKLTLNAAGGNGGDLKLETSTGDSLQFSSTAQGALSATGMAALKQANAENNLALPENEEDEDEDSMLPQRKKRKRKKIEPIDLDEEISDQALEKKERMERISGYVQQNPQDAAKLIHAWITEDE